MPRPMPNPMRPHRTLAAIVFGRSWSALALALLLFTALIWLRLRLVTDVPRQAYADPREGSSLPVAPDASAPGDGRDASGR